MSHNNNPISGKYGAFQNGKQPQTPQESYFNIPNSPSSKLSISSYYNSYNSYGSPQASPINLAETGRRPSGNNSRISSFLYNNSFMSNSNFNNNANYANNHNSNSNSSTNEPVLNSTQNSSTEFTPTHTPPQLRSYNSFADRSSFHASNEILACDRSWETPNLVAIATPRNLQLLKVSNTDITLETELTMKPVGRTKISTISDLAFGHQQFGRYLAASTITGSVHIYHFDRGTRVKSTLNGHTRAVNSINFNPLSPHLLASGSQDGKILIWDLKASSSKPSMTLSCNADAVRCCSFNNKKPNILAAVFDSGVVEKWDLRKNTSWERRVNAHTGPALSVDWHPELDYIVTGGRDKQLQVWNLEAGHESREPAHVIYTSGPIFKAKWCKGRGNNSIMNTDIAVSFFNDDPCVQLWNLNRKFIPKTVIEGHSAQVTQILWRTPKQLISCSRDKTLVQYDVTKEPEFINNVKHGAFAWNPSNDIDFAFIKQEKSQFEGPFNNNNNNTRSNAFTDLNTVEEVDLSNNTVISNNSGTFENTNSNSMQLYEMPNKSPNGNSPTLPSSLKLHRHQMMSRQPSYIKPIVKSLPPPAWVTPVHIPLRSNDTEKFKFLSSNYIIRVPEGSDLLEVCEFNSNLAATVGHFRDSQTWKTIKTAILLETRWKSHEDIESKLKSFAFDNMHQNFSRSDSHLGTSFGSESDMNKEPTSGRSELSISYGSETNVKPLYDESAILDEDDENEKNKDEILSKADQASENESDSLNHSQIEPIVIEKDKKERTESKLRRYRYSFNGSSVDLDNEKTASPLSLSSSPLLHRSRSRLMLRSDSFGTGSPMGVIQSVDTHLSKISDNRSHLTAIMKERTNTTYDNGTIHEETASLTKKKTNIEVPWNPTDLIREAAQYSASQGDTLMCATLALLFEQEYPESITKRQSEEWIQFYHEYLLRCGYFNNAATVLRIASETHEEFKTIGQTKTSVRTLCCHCMKPITNDRSKDRYKEKMKIQELGQDSTDFKIDFGFWYCDKCRKLQGGCCYCSEPIKGNSIALVQCGHEGHFGCFRSWFIEQDERECPACGTVCLKA